MEHNNDQAPLLSSYKNYNDVPWHRRSSSLSFMLIIGVVCCAPLIWASCIICLTGNVYYKTFNDDGSLATWLFANKIASIIVLLIHFLYMYWLWTKFPW